jgi:hypothetical protein
MDLKIKENDLHVFYIYITAFNKARENYFRYLKHFVLFYQKEWKNEKKEIFVKFLICD